MEKKEINVIEYIWRNCYQIVGWDKKINKDNFPTIFGSGFFIEYKNNLVFVTADHVLHPDDYDNSENVERSQNEYSYAIVNNINKENSLETVLTPIGGFYNCDEFNFKKYIVGEEDLDVASIPKFMDLSISIVDPKKFKQPFLTHKLIVDEDIVVNEGLEKLCIKGDAIVLPTKDNLYVVAGVLQNEPKGVRWGRVNVIYCDLKYEGEEFGLYKFCYNGIIDKSKWEGLSGSPFFDTKGGLVGMIIRVLHGGNLLWVLPMNEILKKAKLFIDVDNLQS